MEGAHIEEERSQSTYAILVEASNLIQWRNFFQDERFLNSNPRTEFQQNVNAKTNTSNRESYRHFGLQIPVLLISINSYSPYLLQTIAQKLQHIQVRHFCVRIHLSYCANGVAPTSCQPSGIGRIPILRPEVKVCVSLRASV